MTAATKKKTPGANANPKTAFGAQKVDLSLIPPSALYHEARAFENGRDKYGAYNWRKTDVEVMTYIAAMQRHIACFVDGEDFSRDALVHHLGHVRASAGIVLDAMENGNLIDNRPPMGKAPDLMSRVHNKKK